MPSRVVFSERQRLFAADLTAEQNYRLGLNGRHVLAAHDWGVVSLENPAYAIDGYGRELLAWTAPATSVFEPNTESRLWIYYCEQTVVPTRPCDDRGSRRIGQSAVAQKSGLAPVVTQAERTQQIMAGRAAGDVPDAPLWPVPVAPPEIVYYTSLTAARVQGVQGKAALQVGPTGSADPFWFAIWQNPDQRRYAANRHNSWFWGDLLIGATLKKAFLTIAPGQFVRIIEKTPGSAEELLTALQTQTPRVPLGAVASGSSFKIVPEPVWQANKNNFDATPVTLEGIQETLPGFEEIGAIARIGVALALVPSATPPAIATQRQIIVPRPKDLAAAVPVQIQCGPLQDADFSPRFSINGSALGKRIDGFSVTGEGGVRIGGSAPLQSDPPILIAVNGTLELPPVKASILDPMFNPLLVLTYIAGLRRANSFGGAWLGAVLTVPAQVGEGEDFTYSLVMTPKTNATIKITHLLQRFRLDDGSSIDAIRTESQDLVGGVSKTISLPVTAFSFGSPGHAFNIEMEMAIKVGDTPSSVLVPSPSPIAINAALVLAVEVNLPVDDFVLVGKAWSYTLITEDRPASQLDSQKVTVTDGVNSLPATGVSSVAPRKDFNYPSSDDSKDVDIVATLAYQWHNNSSPNTPKKVKKTVHVGGIQLSNAPLVANVAQPFQLTFKNTSGAEIDNLRNLTVTVMAGPTVLGTFTELTTTATHFDLLDGESKTIPATPWTLNLVGQAAGTALTLTVAYGLTRRNKNYPKQTHTIPITL